jgi:hypothetical protein
MNLKILLVEELEDWSSFGSFNGKGYHDTTPAGEDLHTTKKATRSANLTRA